MSGLQDEGFVDLDVARASLRLVGRRLALREGIGRGRASLAALLHMLDHRAEADGDKRSPLGKSGVGLTSGNEQGAVDQFAVLPVEGREQAEQELLEGMDLVLQFLDRLNVGMRHGLFSLHAGEATPATEAGHRLSEGAK